MIFLPSHYSDHALFQHSSDLTVRGRTDASGDAEVYINLDGNAVTSARGEIRDDGRFDVTVVTPTPSSLRYELVVCCGDEKRVISDVLFGELWLACGQSNMEMTNASQDNKEKIRAEIAKRNIRFLYIDRAMSDDGEFPYSPVSAYDSALDCKWADGNDELFYDVSAAATSFSLELYDKLAERGDIPVGFTCTNKGGSSIETWIPRDELKSESIVRFLGGTKRDVTQENWNKRGADNYQQPAAYYNYMIEPLIGLTARGMLWYQGETNAEFEYEYRVYDKLLIALYESFKARFAADRDNFPLFASLLYPCVYPWRERSGECRVGYLNDALVRLAKERPNEFYAMPIGDLPFTWDFANGNHPIHPTHKYALGKRLAGLVLAATYSTDTSQPRAATLASVKRAGGAIYLSFDGAGSGLRIDGKRLRGIYVRSREGVYTPARAEIVDERTLKVYHPYIDFPYHAAYGVSSAEPTVNLFAGNFPVCPFCTEFGEGEVNIQIKSFTDTFTDSEWLYEEITGERKVAFRRPVFHQGEGEICFDGDFTLSGRSLRVMGEHGSPLSFYIKGSAYHELDLNNYSAIKACLLNTKGLIATLKASVNGRTVEIVGKKGVCRGGDWYEYTFTLRGINAICDRMDFCFRFIEKNASGCTVNVDEITLVPKL